MHQCIEVVRRVTRTWNVIVVGAVSWTGELARKSAQNGGRANGRGASVASGVTSAALHGTRARMPGEALVSAGRRLVRLVVQAEQRGDIYDN